MATIEQLQQQLRQLNMQQPGADRQTGYFRSPGTLGTTVPVIESGVDRLNQQRIALFNQINQAQGAGASDRIEAARNEAYGLARGAVNDQNPIDQQILAMLQSRSGADGGPYNQATRNALMTQASDTAGQVALNARGRIQGSAGDPSVMAANNEADARRLQSIQQAQLGINSMADVANYNARGQALGQLGSYNQQMQGNKADARNTLINMLGREHRETEVGAPGGIPSFSMVRGTGPVTSGGPDPAAAANAAANAAYANRNPGTAAAQTYNFGSKPKVDYMGKSGFPSPASYTGGVPGNNAYQFFPQPNQAKVIAPAQPVTQPLNQPAVIRNTNTRFGPQRLGPNDY